MVICIAKGESPVSDNGKINAHYLIEAHGNLAYAHWSDGPFCPHCGENKAFRTILGQTERPGIYRCMTCGKHFSGTLDILEDGAGFGRAEPPFMIVFWKLWRLRRHPLAAKIAYPFWFGGHLLRQIFKGSDPLPPNDSR